MISIASGFLRLIRLPNLVITALALWSHWFLLLRLPLDEAGIMTAFGHGSIACLGLVFALLMGAGFIINDIYDMQIDAVNKGEKRIVGNRITVDKAWMSFYIMLLGAALLALVIAFYFNKTGFFWIFPVVALLLVIYSIWLKKTAFWGNLLIAILCGSVLLIPLATESDTLASLSVPGRYLIFKNFFICAFTGGLLTLARELVKDIEDIPGDQAGQARTLPILYGIGPAKTIAFLLTLSIVILALSLMLKAQNLFWRGALIILPGFIFPLIYVLYRLAKSDAPGEFHLIANLLKICMVSGMTLLPVYLAQDNLWNG